MFLLDANVISELRKAKQGTADSNVLAWARARATGELYVSTLTLFEIERGIALIDRRDPPAARALTRWYEQAVLSAFAERVLAVDLDVARRASRLGLPDPVPLADALIAATALAHRLTVVTRNVEDFQRFDVPVVNPWLDP